MILWSDVPIPVVAGVEVRMGRGRDTYRYNLEQMLSKERIIGLNTERVSETMEAKGHVNKAVAAIHSLYPPLPLVAEH